MSPDADPPAEGGRPADPAVTTRRANATAPTVASPTDSTEALVTARLECGCHAVAGRVANRFGGDTTRWIRCPEHRGHARRPSPEAVAEHLADARHALTIARNAEKSDNSTDVER
jgi:hypothetical protein